MSNTTKESDRRPFDKGEIVCVRSGHKRGTWVTVYASMGSFLHVRPSYSDDRSEAFWLSAHKVERLSLDD